MNLYDLSIGEDKMNQFLSIALKTHFESLKVSGKGENYWQCYQAFLNYCDIYGDCDLKDLFNNKLLRQDIVRACVLYYNSSAKAHRKEAVNRFLLNSHPSFPFCKRVSHFESDLQILYPTFHFCNDFPVFFLAFMI